jgi:hypothetical protein
LCAGIFALLIALLALSALSCLEPVGFEEDNIPPSELPSQDPATDDPPTDDPPTDDPPVDDPPEDDPPPGPDPILSVTIPGIQPVTGELGKIYSSTDKYVGDIHWDPLLPAGGTFEPFKDYTAKIELAMKGGHVLPPAEAVATVEGALSAAYDAATGTVTARFPRTHYSANTVAELISATTTLLPSTPAGAGNETLIKLTQAFYDSTEVTGATAPLYIGIGTDDTIPYTIRGLGKLVSQKLPMGILLANNNITLEDVRIEITDSTKGVPRKWSGSSSYRAAILIGRYETAPGSGASFEAGLGSKNVTVKNCNISFKVDNSMIAGILISDGTDRVNEVSIDHNDIAVEITNDKTYAAQALLLYRYDPGISITNNGLSSKNRPIIASESTGAPVNPAGGILMHIFPNMADSVTPLISGNVINGSPTYDFYINIQSAGDRTSIPALIENKFATPQSTWMTKDSTDTGSFYKKLLTTLLSQSRTGAGYGFLALWLKYSDTQNDFVFECYAQESNRLSAIDFWGYTINNNAYTLADFRTRLLLNEAGSVYDTDTFHWTSTIVGTNINFP